MATVHSVMGGSTSYFSIWLLLQSVNSINISIVGPRQYAQLDQSLLMTCTVPESELQLGTVRFQGSNSRIICSWTAKTCARFTDTFFGYNCSCGANGVFNLTILKVSMRDMGVWTCVRSSRSSLYLNVYYGPFKNVTVDKDSPLTVTEDKNVSLPARCSADCNPECNYTWTKGSVQVSHKRDLPVSGFNRTQMGNYTCTARNPFTGERAHSQTLTVDVQWRPASPTNNCPSWIVFGKTRNCTCQTKDIGNPAGTVQWIDARDQTVTSSGSSTVQLNLTSIGKSDKESNFICRANNSLPNSNSDITYVARTAYMDRPNITLDKQDVHENDSVTVTCTVVSNPTVEMTIDHINSNMTLVAADNNTITHTIKSVQCRHNGTFRCTTKNSQTGTDNNMAHLNVTCSPRQAHGESLTRVVPGKLMTFAYLRADVIANPLPTFTWYNHSSSKRQVASSPDSMIDTNGLSSTLKIRIKGEGDYATYSVDVENNFGNTALFFSLIYDPSMPKVQSFNIIPIVVGIGAAVLVTMIIVAIVIHHKRGVLKCTGNSNKKDCPTQQGEGDHAMDNVYIEGDDGLKYGRDEDGLMYVGVEFGNQATPTAAPEWTDEATEYAGIAHGIVGCPLPPDKEDEKKEK